MDLKETRNELAEQVDGLYSPDNCSRGWVKCNAAEKQLAEFDRNHPEVIAEIKAAQAAKDKATADKLGWI